ncbi:MAG: SPOR domain-containing protein, partial [Bacteroidales bacterium]
KTKQQEPAVTGKETVKQDSPGPPRRIERKQVNKWRIIWIVVGSLIAVLALILLIPTENGIEFGRDGIVIREKDSEKELLPSRDPNESRIERETTGSEEVEDSQEEDRPVTPPVQQNKYFIIAGSFQSLPNATELMNDLKASGFPAEIIITENRLYRVSVSSFATKEAALRELPGIKNEPGLGSAWLMTR